LATRFGAAGLRVANRFLKDTAVVGEPVTLDWELSTASTLIVSYHDPDSGPGGHIVVSAIPD